MTQASKYSKFEEKFETELEGIIIGINIPIWNP